MNRPSGYRQKALLVGALAASSIALAMPASAQMPNTSRETGRDKVALSISGHVNKAVLFAKDGRSERTLIVDNASDTTRLTLTAEGPVNEDISFGAQIQVELSSNNSGIVTLHTGAGDNNQLNRGFTERVAEVTMVSKRFGKISLGQGSTATDTIVESDLSGTAVSGNYADSAQIGSSFVFFNDQTKAFDGPAVSDVVVSLNGSLDDRIRYDTPTIAGFTGSASFTSGGPGELALRFADKIGPFELAAALGYANLSGINATVDDQVVGSVAVLHESGLNAAFSAGKRNHKAAARDDGKSIYGKVGYIAKVFGVGPTAFGVDYGAYNDYGQNDDKAKTYSIGVVQHFEDIGSQIYLLGKTYELDRTAADYDNINLLMIGTRVQF